MATYEMTGTVKMGDDLQTFASGFSKREFVVVTDDKYPQEIKFEAFKDKATLLDNVREGDTVEVRFAINGREYNGKYYTSLIALSIKNQTDREYIDPSAAGDPIVDEIQF